MGQKSFQAEVLIFMSVVILNILLSHLISKAKLTFLHQSTVAIFMGFITALILKLLFDRNISFSNDFFFSLMLPPIVFAVGYTIKKTQFFQHFLTIVFFGIVSTLLSITLQALILFGLNNTLIMALTAKDILLITIVTSSSDPITALPLLNVIAGAMQSHSNKLEAMVTGQSMLSCAVGIILFQTVLNTDLPAGLQTTTVVTILLDFLYIFLFSLLLGILLGLGLSYIFKFFQSFSEFHIKEISLILLTGYAVYFLGEFLGLSGIISLFTAAIIFSKYGFNNLSLESRHGTVLAFDSIRYLLQTFIFAYLGASLLTIDAQWSAITISIIIILVIPLIRFLSVSVLPLLYKITGRTFPLIRTQRKLFWYTGLIRGIIAFALSLRIESDNARFLKTVSIIVVMFTTVVGSTFINRFGQMIGLGDLGLISTGEEKVQREVQMIPSSKYGVIGIMEQMKQTEQEHNHEKLAIFQQKYLKPIFTRQHSPTVSPQGKKMHSNPSP